MLVHANCVVAERYFQELRMFQCDDGGCAAGLFWKRRRRRVEVFLVIERVKTLREVGGR